MEKGVTFSFILILIGISIVSIVYLQRNVVYKEREAQYLEIRLKDMDRTYTGIVRDVNKAVNIITKRSISVLIGHVLTTGGGVQDADSKLEELVLYGTLNGQQKPLMQEATLQDWIEKMMDVGDNKGYFIVLTYQNFDIRPYDSWHLIATANFTVNITDKNGIASLNRNFTASEQVSLEGFEDPLYSLNTLGRITNTIRKTPDNNYTTYLTSGDGSGWVYGETVAVAYAQAVGVADKGEKILVTDDAEQVGIGVLNQFKGVVSEGSSMPAVAVPYMANASYATTVIPNQSGVLLDGDNGKVWLIENLVAHVEGNYYDTSVDGSSFLDRLESSLVLQEKYSSQSNRTIGLESFIGKDKLLLYGIEVKEEQTNIDYLYFSNSTTGGDRVKGLDSSVRVDSNHQGKYGVEGIVIG